MNIIPRFGRNVTSGLFNYTKKYTTAPTPNSTPASTPQTNPVARPSLDSNVKYQLTPFRKFLCVWAKRYPAIKDVPDQVNYEVWGKVRSIIRIKVANYTMLLILVGCVVMVVTGKRARDRGESIMQRNLDWHQRYSDGKEEEVKNISLLGK